MSQSYLKKIFLIYITKSLGFLTGLASVFLVIPALASNPSIFGVYSVCISMTIFFSYADLGFIAAGQKYAAEFFAQGDKIKELEVVGFVIFLLTIFFLVISSFLLLLAFNPEWLVKKGGLNELEISRHLLLILAISAPITLLQRFNSIIYSVRLADYIFQIIEIMTNFLKICCIGFFVTSKNYNIVGYFLTIQSLSLAAALISMLIAFKKYHFTFRETFSYIRFSDKVYNKTKALAFSTFMLMISWILYFEIDSLLLSRIYGLNVVAIYAISFSVLSFCRNLYNTLYSPFQTRFNHFVGLGDEYRLFKILDLVIKFTFPLCIIPPIVLILYMKMIVVSWVGLNYISSVLPSRMFVITAALLAITTPLSYILIAKARIRILRISALFLPFIFFISLFLFDKLSGVNSLAFAKTTTILCSSSVTFFGIYRITGPRLIILYRNCILKCIMPICILCVYVLIFPPVLNITPRSYDAYFQLFIHLAPATLIPLLIYYLLDKEILQFVIQKFNNKFKTL